ncbi:PHB depolymerase family esterase [Inhella gelatinilytica]|uniref:Poly(3-hydroxybutyrate) depolymerase n=1 Tax=Inhella gelatinilytica TaxID=2795030 RepID=A0A931NCA7_9BURK|nr:PHB depolymerase family esterase [Inhella gelatinilytica]MBH9551792.1 hypothetical protein [Inhella gelatinilytica]
MIRPLLALLLLGFSLTAQAQDRAPLPALQTEGPASVSGVSSGAYMAVQLWLAQAPRFEGGLATVAGGPYACAQSVFEALGPCLGRQALDEATLAQRAQAAITAGALPAQPRQGRAYLFAGAKDAVVAPRTTAALATQLQGLRPELALQVQTQVPAGHGWVTVGTGSACDQMQPPYLLACGFDLAGSLLQHLLGPLQAPTEGASGRLLAFDQRPFHAGADLADTGYLFIPSACEAGGCRVHVALHGCRMNGAAVGDAFARGSGLNAWAAANRLVVLYPQTGTGAVNGCWDWWGYADARFAGREGPQQQAIVGMLDRLAARR